MGEKMQSRVAERAAGQLSDLGEVTLLVGSLFCITSNVVIPLCRSYQGMDAQEFESQTPA